MLVLSSPSGAGKTTISRLLLPADDPALEGALAAACPGRPCTRRAFSLSGLLREAADRSTGEARSGLTDEEWLADAARRGAFDATTLEQLGELFTRLGEVKYGASVPSRFAMDDLLEKSETTLRTLARVQMASSEEKSA
jgi:hypothetical protein